MANISVVEMRKALEKKYTKEWVKNKSDSQIMAIYYNAMKSKK